MVNLDALFLFEVFFEEIKNYTNEDVVIKCNFGNIFEFQYKEYNKKVSKSKQKHRKRRKRPEFDSQASKVQSGQSTLYASTFEDLVKDMKDSPIKLSVTLRKPLMQLLGTTNISWSKEYFEYLHLTSVDMEAVPVSLCDEYLVCNKGNSKKLALVKLRIKLSHLPINKQESTIDIIKDVVESPNLQNFTEESKDPVTGDCDESYIPNILQNNISEYNNEQNLSKKHFLPFCSFSDSNIMKRQEGIIETKSVLDIQGKKKSNVLNYSFWNNFIPKISYYVGYAMVKCGSKCSADKTEFPREGKPVQIVQDPCTGKCQQESCETKGSLPARDDRIFLDFGSLGQTCCTEEVTTTLKASLKAGKLPCDCACECEFGFTRKTTFCGICGGFEVPGNDCATRSYPCPVFHKLVDVNKLKTYSSREGSEKSSTGRSRRGDKKSLGEKVDKKSVGEKGDKKAVGEKFDKKVAGEKKHKYGAATDKSIDSDNASSKGSKRKKKLKDPRFIFNYGYTAPKIGHGLCKFPHDGPCGCGRVPKNKGWQWDADNLVGMKSRPGWKPGAAHKRVVKMLKIAKHPEETMMQKRKKLKEPKQTKKEIRPQLVVHKLNGEYNISMKVMKAFNKPRPLNVNPFEELPLTYNIGRTERENILRKKKNERRQRRLEREQRAYIQSTFKDLCKEICRKKYLQTLGMLNDTEDPDCRCFLPYLGIDNTHADEHSCSCSEDSHLSELDSASDNDEWILEFTPPTARYDPNANVRKVSMVDTDTQYTYLDYRVKLLDRFGNQVPRYFIGPDGKKQCSDLGGFWGPNKKWLTINVDGFIGADKKWAPMIFMGPGGERVEAVNEKFQTSTGDWLVVGIDGYVNAQGVWCFYKNAKGRSKQNQGQSRTSNALPSKSQPGDSASKTKSPVTAQTFRTHGKNGQNKPSGIRPGSRGRSAKAKNITVNVTTVSSRCFGDATVQELTEKGITGHGLDRKILSPGRPKRMPLGPKVRRPNSGTSFDSRSYFLERTKCHHTLPSTKGIIASDGIHKTYFRIKPPNKNKRFRDRLLDLEERGIIISSSHVPCLHSFINSQALHQEIRERLDRNYGNIK